MGKQDRDQAGKSAAGVREPTTTEIKTVEDLESLYPQLIREVKDSMVHQMERCTAEQARKNLPELYKRIAMDVQGKSGPGPDPNEPGFLLDIDDPFGEGALRIYQELKRIDGLRLPYVLPLKDKGNGEIRDALWERQYEKSKKLKAEFKDARAFIAFKKKIITQTLENYILRADDAGDTKRADAARDAMKEVK